MGKGKRRAAGEGHVRQRADGLWEARLPLPGGKSKSYYAPTQKEAIAKRNAARGSFATHNLDAEKMSVEAYLASWLSSIASSVSESTLRRYEQAVRVQIVPEIGTVKLAKLGPGHVELLKATLLKKLSPATANQTLLILSIALNRAVRWELLDRNPAQAVERPRKKQPHDTYQCLAEGQAARLVAQARGTPEEALYVLALKYGPREGELAALRWRDIDLERGTLFIRKSKTGVGRTIKLAPSTVELLRRRRGLPGAYVFPDEKGEKQSAGRMLGRLRKHLKAAGLPKIRFHDLRDTAATLMLYDGFPLHHVARVLGHEDPAMTLRRYSHVLEESAKSEAEKLDRWAF